MSSPASMRPAAARSGLEARKSGRMLTSPSAQRPVIKATEYTDSTRLPHAGLLPEERANAQSPQEAILRGIGFNDINDAKDFFKG